MLSGGEKARLMFLSIRINQPNFLLLDEPTNHIDIQGKEELEAQILESNATVLITSHDRSFVDHIANRYVMIDQGHLIELNSPSEFYASLLTQQISSATVDTPIKQEGKQSSEEEMLQQLIDLEEKLAADLERKPKFQKTARHPEWREAIRALKAKLDAG